MKIIENWRSTLRSYSAICLSALVAIPIIWEQMPPEVVALIPDPYDDWTIAAIALLGLAGRFIKQEKLTDGSS